MSDQDAVAPHAVPVLSTRVRIRNLHDKTFVGQGEQVFEMSGTARFIWRQIDGGRTVLDISEIVSKEYEISQETALEDVQEFVVELVGLGVLRIRNHEQR
ncbi:PqqD family protein [Streptosporangium subroseum]|uniref:PqqD family protein n=1 Tax=Streptosporangium subroseum TaxID=106412 RepID=UPI0030913F5B|nr:PqqD family protein [Streptosporangium subroseum]